MKSQKIVFFSLTLLAVFSHDAQGASSSAHDIIVQLLKAKQAMEALERAFQETPETVIFLNTEEKECPSVTPVDLDCANPVGTINCSSLSVTPLIIEKNKHLLNAIRV